MVLSSGAKLGPFQVEREIGRGGMGEVYLARDTRLDRLVAIKALPGHLATDTDRLTRFQREARVLATLHHPGLGGIYGVEEAEGRQYLILEYVDGRGATVTRSIEYRAAEGLAWPPGGVSVLFSSAVQDGALTVRELSMDGTVVDVLASHTGIVVFDAAPPGAGDKLLASDYQPSGTVIARFPGAESEHELPGLGRAYLPIMTRDGRPSRSAISHRRRASATRCACSRPTRRPRSGLATGYRSTSRRTELRCSRWSRPILPA